MPTLQPNNVRGARANRGWGRPELERLAAILNTYETAGIHTTAPRKDLCVFRRFYDGRTHVETRHIDFHDDGRITTKTFFLGGTGIVKNGTLSPNFDDWCAYLGLCEKDAIKCPACGKQHGRTMAQEHNETLRQAWLNLCDDASTSNIKWIHGYLAGCSASKTLSDEQVELWTLRIEKCPGHDTRSWCAYCGDVGTPCDLPTPVPARLEVLDPAVEPYRGKLSKAQKRFLQRMFENGRDGSVAHADLPKLSLSGRTADTLVDRQLIYALWMFVDPNKPHELVYGATPMGAATHNKIAVAAALAHVAAQRN